MPYDALEYHKRGLAINKLRELHSPLAVSAMESLDAALWLLGGWRIPQSLSLLHNAIELAFKGELEHIHDLAARIGPAQLRVRGDIAVRGDHEDALGGASRHRVPPFAVPAGKANVAATSCHGDRTRDAPE